MSCKVSLPLINFLSRVSLGWIFLWAYLDKLFGLGFATKPEASWLAGGSPTSGFLGRGTSGPFAGVFQALAGQAWVDWLFMIGLLLIGLALILGVGMRIATTSGAILLFLMWLAVLPKENNPFMDDHIIYIFILMAMCATRNDHKWSLNNRWSKLPLVKKHPWLA